MKEKLEDYLKHKEEFEKEFKEWVKDKSIPLQERWNLFIQSGLGEDNEIEFAGIDWNIHTFYDDFYMNRYATQSVKHILEMAFEKDLFKKGGDIEFMEECLENFTKTITNDW